MESERQVPIGGDFNSIFDHKDYLAMVSIPDEATAVLRGHLILEEVLNLWGNKLTGVEDLYAGAFFSFKIKMEISRNLGLNDDIYAVLDKVNVIRNDFSHRKEKKLEYSALESLASRVDAIDVPETLNLQDARKFHLFIGGKDQDGTPTECTYTWDTGDNRTRFVIVFMTLMLKLTHWIQVEFDARHIPYTIISADISTR